MSTVCTAQTINPSAWKNQSGSYLVINQVSTEGQINGYYINNNNQGFNCVGTPYPLTGWVLNGTNTITFTVKWNNAHENCQSLTSWTGFTSNNNSNITTLWQLVRNGTSSTGQILQGSDVFKIVDYKKQTSLIKDKKKN